MFEVPRGGCARQAPIAPLPLPPYGAKPSMSAGCGTSWAPLHILPGYQDSGPCPVCRRPCKGQGIWNVGLSTSRQRAAIAALPRGWRSLFPSLHKIHADNRGTGWKMISSEYIRYILYLMEITIISYSI